LGHFNYLGHRSYYQWALLHQHLHFVICIGMDSPDL
jgi:hypothetical protein